MSRTDEAPPLAGEAKPPAQESPPEGGCVWTLLALGFWTVVWMGVCFLLYWKVSPQAGEAAFLVPPIGLALWALFTKPGATRDLDSRR